MCGTLSGSGAGLEESCRFLKCCDRNIGRNMDRKGHSVELSDKNEEQGIGNWSVKVILVTVLWRIGQNHVEHREGVGYLVPNISWQQSIRLLSVHLGRRLKLQCIISKVQQGSEIGNHSLGMHRARNVLGRILNVSRDPLLKSVSYEEAWCCCFTGWSKTEGRGPVAAWASVAVGSNRPPLSLFLSEMKSSGPQNIRAAGAWLP